MEIKDIEHLAALARIGLSEDEKKKLLKDADGILRFVEIVQEVVTEDSTEERVGILRNVMREDTKPHDSGIYTKALLGEAPYTHDGYIKVKKIL